ncbi:MAG: heme-binding protein [Gammaproteobacteria bacterium]|nr:heme-binding protein [Gammaproteobacteria bacterium]
MIEMTLEMARMAAETAHEASKQFEKPMSVSVVDEAGRLVFYSRADGAGFFTFDTSRAKAMAAASFRRSTTDITENKDQNPLLWYSLPSVMPAQALPSPGGVPIWKDSHVIGAIGIGGGAPDEDNVCAIAGANAIGSDTKK